MLKQCCKCLETKPLELFYRDKSRADGRTPRCANCPYKKIGHAHLVKPDKLCNRCKVRKDKSEFYAKDNHCKPCSKEKNKARKRNAGRDANAAKTHRRRAAQADLPAFTWGVTKDEIAELRADMPACVKCGSEEDLRLDHVVPVAEGGKSIFWNYQILCAPCNGSKGATYVDYRNGMYA